MSIKEDLLKEYNNLSAKYDKVKQENNRLTILLEQIKNNKQKTINRLEEIAELVKQRREEEKLLQEDNIRINRVVESLENSIYIQELKSNYQNIELKYEKLAKEMEEKKSLQNKNNREIAALKQQVDGLKQIKGMKEKLEENDKKIKNKLLQTIDEQEKDLKNLTKKLKDLERDLSLKQNELSEEQKYFEDYINRLQNYCDMEAFEKSEREHSDEDFQYEPEHEYTEEEIEEMKRDFAAEMAYQKELDNQIADQIERDNDHGWISYEDSYPIDELGW